MASTGCKSKQSTAGNYSYKTECLGNSLDGSQTVKAWGTGRDKNEAIESAKKNALNDLLFKGIIEGKSGFDSRPIIVEVNARSKYENYFNTFFSKGNDYNLFVSIDEKKKAYQIIKSRERITCGIVMKLQSAELKQKMITDGILK
ncbi:hypothetical protein [Lutibacter sp.]|uniref:hypothetical protein n=1 Tax=Lutibacter sp. TaxID=1925666 RepID=UPI003567EC3C